MKLGNEARTPRPRELIQPEHADEASALLHELALGVVLAAGQIVQKVAAGVSRL